MNEKSNDDKAVKKKPDDAAKTADNKQTAAGISDLSTEQGTENYIETYHAISEWIRFADAKAAVILTVGAAMAGFLIPTIHTVLANNNDPSVHLFPYWQEISVGIFSAYILFLLLSGIYAFLCINPSSSRGRHPSFDYCDHFHPAAIAAKYRGDQVTKFVDDCDKIGATALRREVQAAILIDSHISNNKYGRVKISLKYFVASVVFGFTYFLIAQL